MDFIKVRRKRPFSERLSMIADLLNKQGVVTVKDLVLNWGCSPEYCKVLLRWAAERYNYAFFDEDTNELFIPTRKDEGS